MAGAQSYYHHAGDFRNGSAGTGQGLELAPRFRLKVRDRIRFCYYHHAGDFRNGSAGTGQGLELAPRLEIELGLPTTTAPGIFGTTVQARVTERQCRHGSGLRAGMRLGLGLALSKIIIIIRFNYTTTTIMPWIFGTTVQAQVGDRVRVGTSGIGSS